MSRRARPISIVVAVLAACLFAGVGFRIGRTLRSSPTEAVTSWQNAAAASFSPARSLAYRRAWQRGYQRGWRIGEASGRSAGTRAGLAAGRSAQATSAVAARAVAAVLAATPIRLGHGIKTQKCIPVGGGLCEALGPRITGKPCPPASVADPQGGVVCVPRVLLLAGRIVHAPSLSVFSP